MKVARAKVVLLLFVLTLLVTSDCTRHPAELESPRPEFSGRLFGIDSTSHRLYEVTRDSTGRSVEYHLLGENILNAAISPNRKLLLYHVSVPGPPQVKDGKLVLRDLLSEQEKVIINRVEAHGLRWSTDSQKFSYLSDNALYVPDISGNTQVVYEAPHAKYMALSESGGSLGAKEMYAPFATPKWIGPDRLLFQRFVGDMPFYPQLAWNELFVEPNTATVVFAGKSPRLVNLDKKWVVRGVCPEQSLLLLGEDYTRGRLYLTSATFDLKQPKLRSLPESTEQKESNVSDEVRKYDFLMTHSEPVRFTPGSCELFHLRQEGAQTKRTTISFLDAATLQEKSSLELKDVGEIRTWIFDPNGRNIAAVRKLSTLDSLLIINVQTGATRALDTYGIAGSSLSNWQLLGWVP